MSLFSRAAQIVVSGLRAVGGETVVYSRGPDAVELVATPVPVAIELTDVAGATIQGQRMDWIVTAADLVLSGLTVRPEAGDRIQWSVGDVVRTFEAMPVGSESHYEQLGPDAAGWKIFTREVLEQAA